MLKLAELTLKVGTVPVFFLPHIAQQIASKVLQCKKFNDYLNKLNTPQQGVELSKVEVLGVEMFGDKVGFVNMRALTSKDGYKLPSYVFLRGHAVAILLFVNDKILVVQQYRVPSQCTSIQAPAGMIDESGDFVGVAAAEIQQQTSIKIKKEDLKPLGDYYPSPGGSDQQIYLYYCRINMSQQQLKVVEDKIHGKEGEKERIRVRFIDYNQQAILKTKDSKLVYAVYAYEAMIKNNKAANL